MCMCFRRISEVLSEMKLDIYVCMCRQISEVLGQMKLDMVNFTISQLRPILKQHSAEYERNKFNSLLSTQNGKCVCVFWHLWFICVFYIVYNVTVEIIQSWKPHKRGV